MSEAFDYDTALADFRAAGEALARRHRKPEPESRRTYQKVLRRSFIAGEERYEPLTVREARRRARAVEMYALKTQRPGVRAGARSGRKANEERMPGGELPPLSYFDVQLYRLLCNCAQRFAGKVHPSYEWLAEAMTGVATRTKQVVEAIKRLEDHKLVRKQRRYVEVGKLGVRGPQVEQTSNFYWVLPLPTIARQLLDSFIRRQQPTATSADEEARHAAQEAQQARWARDEAWEAARGSSRALAAADAKMAAELGVFIDELPEVTARLRNGKGVT